MQKFKLRPIQKEALRFFEKNKLGRNFYWTGGTLLAYRYFDHRDSIDLDFFSGELFRDDEYLIFINELKKHLKAQEVRFTLKNNRRIYTIKRGDESLKLELVFFPFRRVEKASKLDNFGVNFDSLTDIMVNKTLSSYQRREVKDAYDLYYYLKNKPKYSLSKLAKLVEKKFGVIIEPPLLLAKINALLDNFNALMLLIFSKDKKLREKIKSFFQEEFNSLVRKKIK